MKNAIIFLVLFVYSAFQLYAQSEISLENLKIPSSPAFVLLDVAPSSIDRPTTTKAFSTSILNSVNENNGIPANYAIDFAPYWFLKHKNLNALNYWGIRKTTEGPRQTVFSQARFGNISFASVKSKIVADTNGTSKSLDNIALGLRTTIVQIRNEADKNLLIDLNTKAVTRMADLMSDPMISPADLIEILEKDSALLIYNQEIADVLKRKPQFAIDIAAAGSWSFEDIDYNSVKSNRASMWLTFNYSTLLNKSDRLQNKYLNIYAITRISNDNNSLNSEGALSKATVFDSGGKIEFELDRLTLSYEYLFRYNFTDKLQNSYRSSGLISYRAGENILITGAFGKNFGDSNNLITQIGITWGLNSKAQRISADFQ